MAGSLFRVVYTRGRGVVMPTERQSESARINGAKSHGPKSAEGKKKSSRNSLRHGCTAGHTILLACEDRLSSSVTHLRRRFRNRKERKIFNARVVRADSLHDIGIGRRMAAGTPRGIK